MNLHNRVILLITAPELLLLRTRFVLYKSAETPPNLWGEAPPISPVSRKTSLFIDFHVWYLFKIIFLLGNTWKNNGWNQSIDQNPSNSHISSGKNPAQRVFPPTFPRLRWGSLIAGTSRGDAEQRASISFLPVSYFQAVEGKKKRRRHPVFPNKNGFP